VTAAAPHVLVVDDRIENRELIEAILEDEGYRITAASTGTQGLDLALGDPPDTILLDVAMPDIDGFTVCRQLQQHVETALVPVIFVSAQVLDKASVCRGLTLGAIDYITKPFDPDDLAITIKNALAHKHLFDENRVLKQRLEDAEKRPSIIGNAPRMKEVFHLIDKVAPTDATVLIAGESGTGKELVARRLHEASNRAAQTMLSINCGALPETLLESELFGYEKGSFTGAASA
jgi:two-component system response regulator AtoC